MSTTIHLSGVEILAPVSESYATILTPEAVAFIVDLHRTFNARRKELLDARQERQKRLDAGERPNFLEDDALHSRIRMDRGAPACGYPGPPGGNYGTRRPQDDHQRAQFRRESLHGRF